MASNEAYPPGYAMYRTEPREGFQGMAILLPFGIKEELIEARRERESLEEARLAQDARQRAREARDRIDQAMTSRGPASSTSSVFANAENAPTIIKMFERGVARRNRARFHPVLSGNELVRVAARISTMRDKDYQRRELEVLDKLRLKGALRTVINPGFVSDRWARSLGYLRDAHPHFEEVTNFVAAQVALAVRSKQPLWIPPIHLWGFPGLGKTHYANDLAEALGAPIRRQSMENAQTTAMLLGTERHWSSATFGIVFDQIVLGNVANPVFLIDELDKTPREGRYDPLAAFHSLLEPLTAKNARDAAMDITFDASLAIYIATSNDPRKIPWSVRSRLHEFEISPPTGEQALQAARVVVKSATAKLNIPGFSEPDMRIAHELAHLTAREIGHAIRGAAARAIEEGRSHLTLADLPKDAFDPDASRRLLH